jgi:hypothetical protein
MQLLNEILAFVATVKPETAEGQRCLKEFGDHLKGLGTAVERYRKATEPKTITIAVATGTAPSKYNRS